MFNCGTRFFSFLKSSHAHSNTGVGFLDDEILKEKIFEFLDNEIDHCPFTNQFAHFVFIFLIIWVLFFFKFFPEIPVTQIIKLLNNSLIAPARAFFGFLVWVVAEHSVLIFIYFLMSPTSQLVGYLHLLALIQKHDQESIDGLASQLIRVLWVDFVSDFIDESDLLLPLLNKLLIYSFLLLVQFFNLLHIEVGLLCDWIYQRFELVWRMLHEVRKPT